MPKLFTCSTGAFAYSVPSAAAADAAGVTGLQWLGLKPPSQQGGVGSHWDVYQGSARWAFRLCVGALEK